MVSCKLDNMRLTSTVHSKIPSWTWPTFVNYTESVCTRWITGYWGEQRRRKILQNRLYSPPCSTADEAGIGSNVSCTVGDTVYQVKECAMAKLHCKNKSVVLTTELLP